MGTDEAIPVTIAFLLKACGVTQEELAKRSGVNKSQISKYLNGHAVPQLAQILRISEGLGVRPVVFWSVLEKMKDLHRQLETRVTGDVLRDADPLFAAVLRAYLGDRRRGSEDRGGEASKPEGDWFDKLLQAQKLALESQRLFVEAMEQRRRDGDG